MRNATVILNQQANNIIMLADDVAYIIGEAAQGVANFFLKLSNHLGPHEIVAGFSLLLLLFFTYLLTSSVHIH